MMFNFKDRLLLGLCTIDAIDDAVGAWHKGAGQGKSLHEYLGLTRSEYDKWLKTGLDDTLLAQIMSQRANRNFRLYQIDCSTPDGQRLIFRPLPAHCGSSPVVCAEAYWQVYEGTVLCGADWPDEKVAERIFYIFNMELPNDFMGRSLSVSDVVALCDTGDERFYYCGSFGFTRVEFDANAAAPWGGNRL